jgi:hypothetical protein
MQKEYNLQGLLSTAIRTYLDVLGLLDRAFQAKYNFKKSGGV